MFCSESWEPAMEDHSPLSTASATPPREYSPLARHGLTDPETAVQHCDVSANAEIHSEPKSGVNPEGRKEGRFCWRVEAQILHDRQRFRFNNEYGRSQND